MKIINKLFLHSPRVYIAALITGAAFILIRLATTGFNLLINYIDAFTLTGGLLILFGLLGLVTRLGAFDMFGYSFSSFRHQSKYKDMYDYKTQRIEKNSHKEWTFMPFVTVGALLLIVGFSLYAFLPEV